MRVWLVGLLCLCSNLFAAESPIDRHFKRALAQLNRVNANLFADKARTILYVDDKLATPVVKAAQKGLSNKPAKQLLALEKTDFHALFEALKLSIEYTHQLTPELVSLSAPNTFTDLSLNPKALLDDALKLDSTALDDTKDLHQLCENLILVGFFSQSPLHYHDGSGHDDFGGDELGATAWLCYTLYEVRSHQRDVALLVMLADMLGYADFALKTAKHLPEAHPLHDYYFTKTNIDLKKAEVAPVSTLLQTLSAKKLPEQTNHTDNTESTDAASVTEKVTENITGETDSVETFDDVLVENTAPKDEAKNRYASIKPDVSALSALLTLRRAVENQSSKTWQAMGFSASKASSPSILFNGIETVPANELRTKLLMLSPLMLVNDFLGTARMQDYWYDTSLRTSIEDISTLTQTLAREVDYPPMQLIVAFSKQINAAPAPTGKFLLPENLVAHYWQSRLLSAYYVLANFLQSENYRTDIIDSLAKVITANRHSVVGGVLDNWLLAITPVGKPEFNLKQLKRLVNDKHTPVELKRSALLTLRAQFKTDALLPFVNDVLREFDSSEAQQLQKWQLMAAFIPEKLNNPKALRYWQRVRLTPYMLDALLSINNPDVIKHVLENKSEQYLLPNHRAQLIAALFEQGADDADWLASLGNVYRSAPNHYGVTKAYLSVLIKHGKDDKKQQKIALEMLDDWVYAGRDLSRSQYLSLIALLAEAKLNVGDIDAAKRVINPTLKYRTADNFHVAMKIAAASDEIKVGQKLLTHFRRHFPMQTTIAREFEFEFALLAGDINQAAKTLVLVSRQEAVRQFDNYIEIYQQMVKSKKLSKAQQAEFLRELKRNKLPEQHINAIRTDHIFT